MHKVLEYFAPIWSFIAGILLWLLDRVCPAIKAGDSLPYGFSRRAMKEPGGFDTEFIRLHLPLFYWKGLSYDYAYDHERIGWWLQSVMVGFIRTPGGFDVRFRTGSFKRGVGMVKRWKDEPWQREAA